MGRKGESRSLKRLNAPAFWRIHRKEVPFTPKPAPGPHAARDAFTLVYIVRDQLGMARTRREVKRILAGGKVLVDGKIRKDPRFPVGLMDVIDIPDLSKTFRLLPSKLYNLQLVEITKDKDVKLCKVLGKQTLRGGKIQLNLHDGGSVVVGDKGDTYNVHDVVKINLKNRSITGHIPFDINKVALVHSGINNGRQGKIISINKALKNDTVSLDDQGHQFDTSLGYVFVIGDTKPVIDFAL